MAKRPPPRPSVPTKFVSHQREQSPGPFARSSARPLQSVATGEAQEDGCPSRVHTLALECVKDLFDCVAQQLTRHRLIARRIGEASLRKALETKLTRVASTAGQTRRIRIVAGGRFAKLDAERDVPSATISAFVRLISGV